MRSSFARRLAVRLRRAMLGLDSRVDSGLFVLRERAGDLYARFSTFMDRFHVSGPRKLGVELACEGLTLGSAGAVILLALAVPAFRETGDDWLKRQDLAVTFLDRTGVEVGKRGIKHDDSFKLDEFPDHFIKAVLATEDRRFFEHFGIDIIGTFRAVSANARASGVVQGGSSITQQLAKNLFLTNERSIERKVKEAFLALWLEHHLTKDQILKLYLDRAYMGAGTFGAAAAADFYFAKSAREMTLAESAMLAGLFKAPSKFAPHINLPAARGRANTVLSNMVEAGFMTEGQVLAYRRNPATPVDRKREASPDYYLDWAFGEVRKLADAGKLGADRVLTVKTPLDSGIQRRSEQALEAVLRQNGAEYGVKQGAVVVMDPDGAMRAIVGGRDYGASQFNRAFDALRQPGSSFKPFVYAAAMTYLPKLYRPDSTVVDSAVCVGDWCPNNYGRSYSGAQPLITALAKSINTIPVKMSVDLGKVVGGPKAGRARILEMSRAMGLTTDIKDTPSLPIGAADVTVVDMTAGYAVFANGGKRAKPYAAIEIRNSTGDTIYRHDRNEPAAATVLSPQVVADMNLMLNRAVEAGTGRRSQLDGIVSSGKTGTTNGYRDAWFVGYTGNYVGGIWFGNDDYAETNNMTGGSLPAMTWKEIMSFAHQGIELRPIPGLPLNPSVTGAVIAQAKPGAVPGLELRRPLTLSKRSFEVLGDLGKAFANANVTRDTAALAPVPVPRGFATASRAQASPTVLP